MMMNKSDRHSLGNSPTTLLKFLWLFFHMTIVFIMMHVVFSTEYSSDLWACFSWFLVGMTLWSGALGFKVDLTYSYRSNDNFVGLQSKKETFLSPLIWYTFIWIWFQNKINFSYLFDNLIYRILKKQASLNFLGNGVVLLYCVCIATIDSILYIPWCDIVQY